MRKLPAAALAVILSLAAIPAFSQNGVITGLTGTVELKPAGAAEYVKARKGDEVAPNTIVVTGFKSTAVITVGSATIIARPLTRLSLSEIARVQDTETINVNLSAGRVRVDVKPPSGTKSDFTVTGPTATASVRGTSFDLDTRNLYVNNGTVVYRGRTGAAVRVNAGGGSAVNGVTARVADPIAMRDAELLPPPPVAGPPAERNGGNAAGPLPGSELGGQGGANYSLSLRVK